MSEIGEQMIIILSTHIVEDVRNLCSDMAILGEGQIIAQGIPNELIQHLNGKIWSKLIHKNDLEAFKNAFNVLFTRMNSGKIQIHVFSESKPEQGFDQVHPDLEDVYFSTLNNTL